MKKFAIAVLLFFIAVFAAGLLTRPPLSAQTAEDEISAKLDSLLQGQAAIMKELSVIKEELDHIRLYTNKL